MKAAAGHKSQPTLYKKALTAPEVNRRIFRQPRIYLACKRTKGAIRETTTQISASYVVLVLKDLDLRK